MGYIGIYLRLLVFGFTPPLVYSVCSSFFVISAGGVEVLVFSPSGGYFVLLGAPFDDVYLEVGGWFAKCGGGCFVRGNLPRIWAHVLNLGGDLV